MLLLIGIDGASPELVERLTSRGRLPTLRALMRHGVYGRLESSPNCNPVSAWASLLTGTNPGKHAAWGLLNIVPGSYDWEPAHARLLRAPTLSQLLTERGLEAGTLFVPMTFPAREAEWTTVAGWLAPSAEAEGFAYPARIAELSRERLGDTPLAPELRSYAAGGRYQEGFELARRGVRMKCEVAGELLGERRWDFLAVDFVETDRLQRWYWHLVDRAHAQYREDAAREHGHLIQDLYAEVDGAIARLAGHLSASDQLIVTSTYGIGLNNRAAECVPQVLERVGLFAKPSSASGHWQRIKAGAGRSMRAAWRAARGVLPGFVSDRLPEWSASESGRAGSAGAEQGVDYAGSAALPAPGGHVLLNLAGEFPEGAVSPEALGRVATRLRSVLSAAIDPATGRRPLEWARPRDEVCHGPYLDRVPHLVTRWRSPRVVSGLTVAGRDGQITVAAPPPGQVPSGAASPEGILIVAGGGVSRAVRLQGARVEDVSATALYLCGAPVPSYLDGRVLTAAIAEEHLAERPVQVSERELPTIIEDGARRRAAREAVEDHLKALSYLG
jgi:predicted AlkP superfamily phosphohydrolase/phosphomutase